MLEIIKTNDGYMVQKDGEDYICDANGDNLWDTYAEAEAVFYGHAYTPSNQSIRDAVGANIFAETAWGKANAAFYAWEKRHYTEGMSDYSDDDRMIWVEGYLEALRDAK
jgi:hypothetical protein